MQYLTSLDVARFELGCLLHSKKKKICSKQIYYDIQVVDVNYPEMYRRIHLLYFAITFELDN